ncbi:MAG: GNVR domain-containing protein [Calothrix sp. MO_167.B42]|nr:GNVR domain-containing protein [Calothrix sp. MO_167.B42]
MKISTIIKSHCLPLVALNGTIIGCTGIIAALSPRTWTASTQFILPDTTTNFDTSLGALGQLRDRGIAFTNELSPLQVQTSIITSDDSIRPVWLSDPEKENFKNLASYKQLFKVKPIDQSTTIRVEVKGSLPEIAKQRTQKLIDTYKHRLNELRLGTSNTRQQFSQTQLQEAEINLQNARNELTQFQQLTGLVSNEEQTKNLVKSIQDLKERKAEITSQSAAAQIRANQLSQQLNLTPQQAMDSLRLGQNKEFQEIRAKLSEINRDIAVNKGIFTEEHPTLISLQEKQHQLLLAFNRQLTKVVPNLQKVDISFGGQNFSDTTSRLMAKLVEVDNESKALQEQASKIDVQLQIMKAQLKKISSQQAQLLDLQRKYEVSEGVYKGIVAQLEQAKITAFNSYPDIQILDQPTVNPKPTSPKLSLMVLGAMLTSIFASLALISYLESRNPLLKSKDLQDIELPILARILTFKPATMGLRLESATEMSFQRLASTLSLMQLENRRLMISSSMSGEGKTAITIGLSAALVALGFRVLVVDGDFHTAKLSQHFGYVLPSKSNALPTVVSINHGLDLLPASPIENGKIGEFVARGSFDNHLDVIQKRRNYDYILVDSSPLGSTSEAALMASILANVLLVVRLGVSDKYMVQESLELLSRHNAQIIGLVMNGVEHKNEGYGYKRENVQVGV